MPRLNTCPEMFRAGGRLGVLFIPIIHHGVQNFRGEADSYTRIPEFIARGQAGTVKFVLRPARLAVPQVVCVAGLQGFYQCFCLGAGAYGDNLAHIISHGAIGGGIESTIVVAVGGSNGVAHENLLTSRRADRPAALGGYGGHPRLVRLK